MLRDYILSGLIIGCTTFTFTAISLVTIKHFGIIGGIVALAVEAAICILVYLLTRD